MFRVNLMKTRECLAAEKFNFKANVSFPTKTLFAGLKLMFLSYRNQSTRLHFKSILWFLYDIKVDLKLVHKNFHDNFVFPNIYICYNLTLFRY